MSKTLILTAIGKDRPGIVAAVAKVLFETGGNIEDSSMTRLGNDFAMILMLTMPAKNSTTLLDKKLSAAGKKLGLSITLRQLSPAELKPAKADDSLPHLISVYGADKPGIVFKIADFLADRKANITDVETKIISPKTNPVYVMMLEVEIPKKANIAHLTAELDRLSQDLSVDINLKPIESYQL